MTIAGAEKNITDQIRSIYDQEEAKAIAGLVLEHVCEVSKAQLFARRHDMLTPVQQRSVDLILADLQTGKPVQYVLGETEFFGLRLKLTPAVLIPRPETEELINWALRELIPEAGEHAILDIGTGSGCIAIALKKYLPGATVSALDASHAALEVAIRNAALNKTAVKFIHQDMLQKPFSSQLSEQYSVIISNPPYIAHAEREQMHGNVLDHEPHEALFVPDNDPLLFYKAIADFALDRLSANGILFFEINESLGKEMLDLMHSKGFVNTILMKDISGKDRMIKAAR